ncbi:hypothetical protein [Nostoc sp. NMS8]|nr:hypothetical protein [Nostoc sp. NMS8]
MGARLRVFLTREQDRTLLNLKTADCGWGIGGLGEVTNHTVSE